MQTKEKVSKSLNKTSEKPEKKFEDYVAEVDPRTGKRYIIPMLSPASSSYLIDYVMFMKMKEVDPEGFQRVLNWN